MTSRLNIARLIVATVRKEAPVNISDQYRLPVVVSKRDDGGIVIRCAAHTRLLHSTAEDRLVAFARDEPVKARLQRFPMAPNGPQVDE
jgi:hypothetical protein